MCEARMNQARNRFHEQQRKEEREQYLMRKRIESLVPESLEILIPQCIKEGKVAELQEIYAVIRHEGSILHQLKREYFIQEFQKAEDQNMRVAILKLAGALNQWKSQEYELAFNLCDCPSILESIIQYIEENPFDKSAAKLQRLVELVQQCEEPQQLVEYCYLMISFMNPPFPQQSILLLLKKIDLVLEKDQYICNCCIILQKFLQPACNMDLYEAVPKMGNFMKIVKSCSNADFEMQSLAFEVCIDILAAGEAICQEMVNRFGLLKIVQSNLQHPLLSLKACWAISNLATAESLIPCLIPILKTLVSATAPETRVIVQIQFIVVNILYTANSSSMSELVEIAPMIMHYLLFIFDLPLRQKCDLHRNCVFAIAKSVQTESRFIKIYLKYSLDKKLQGFLKEHPDFHPEMIESVLNVLAEGENENDF